MRVLKTMRKASAAPFLISVIVLCLASFCAAGCSARDNSAQHTPASLANTLQDEQILQRMSVEQKVGQLFCVSISGRELNDNSASFIKDYNVGNVILFSKNMGTAPQTAHFCRTLRDAIVSATGVVPFIGTDQEGGNVVRITEGATPFPSEMAIAATGDTHFAEEVGRYTSEELKALGISLNFAPDADVNTNPENPVIGIRSYGSSPQRVADYTTAYEQGAEAAREVTTPKHYPGHGDTSVDSHLGLPSDDATVDELLQDALVSFKAAIDAGAPAIMAAHILYPRIDPTYPASLSQTLLQDVLRKKLGFDGMIVTDSLRMGAITEHYGTAEACVRSIQAGANLLITGTGGAHEDDDLSPQKQCIKRVVEAVKSGEISDEVLNAAVLKVLQCKRAYKVDECAYRPLPDAELAAHVQLARRISQESITMVKNDGGLIPLAVNKSGQSDADQHKILALSNNTVARLDESDTSTELSFAEYIAKQTQGDAQHVTGSMSDAEIAQVAAQAAHYETVVLAVTGDSYIPLARAVIAANPHTIVVSLGFPYIFNSLNACKAFICAYGYTPYAVESMCNVLLGKAETHGSLPVALQ